MHGWLYGFTQDQGSIISGVMALIAGIIAYKAGLIQAKATQQAAEGQIHAERERRKLELDIARRSVALELRQVAARAFGAHLSTRRLIEGSGQITARMLDSSVSIPIPIIFPSAAEAIAQFEEEAMDVLIFFNLIEIAREGTDKLMKSRAPDDLSRANVAAIATALMQACVTARDLLPRLKTGIATHDDKDEEFIAKITAASLQWNAWLAQQR